MNTARLYKKILISFIIYAAALNFICFATTFSPKSLINPFNIKNRSISVFYLAKHIILIEGIAIRDIPDSRYEELIKKYSEKYNVEEILIKAVIEAESGYRRFAISRAGAMGLMQIMPVTFHEQGFENPFDIEQNIEAGTKYLSVQLKHFDKIELALAAYNAGPGKVRSNGYKVPDIGETKLYVEKIMNRYKASKLLKESN